MKQLKPDHISRLIASAENDHTKICFNVSCLCLHLLSSSTTLGTLIDSAKAGSISRFIGRSRSEDSVCNSPNNRNESASHSNSPNSDEAVTESPTDSNSTSIDKPDVEHKHQHQQHSSHHPSDPQRNSNVNSSSSNSNTHNKKDHHLHMHLNFGALAALKRKRKKFSNSRNESPVLVPPPEHCSPTSSLKKSIKKVIKYNNFVE